MNKLLFLPLVLTTACVGTIAPAEEFDSGIPVELDPYLVIEEALMDWERDFGTIGQECRNEFLTIDITRGDDWDHTAEFCGKGRAGCFYVTFDNNQTNYFIVYTKDDEERYVLYHEFVHWVLYCTTGALDGNHTQDLYWDWAANITGAERRA